MKKHNLLLILSMFIGVFSTQAQNCQASFLWDSPSFLNVNFTDSSTTVNTMSSKSWDFGDGTTYVPRNLSQTFVTHYYNNGGTYYTCLTITDNLNCSSTFCDSVTVNGYSSASCMPAYSYTVDSNNTVTFTNLTGPDSNYSYEWHFWDTTNIIDTNKNPVVHFSAPGMLHFSMDAINNNTGVKCALWDTIPINFCEPTIAYSMGQNDSVYFSNWNVHRNFQYTWDFGDSSATVNWERGWHHFPSSKNYQVSLTIYDSANNCTSTVTDSILLGLPTNQRCRAEFRVEKDTTAAFNVVLYNYSSNSAQNSYTWDFGDGNKAYTRNPNHNYSSFGAYEVCLTVEHWGYRCKTTFCDTIDMDSLGNLKAGFGIEVRDPIAVGIQEEKDVLQNFSIYPNPAQTEVKIDLSNMENSLNLRLIDFSGRTLIENKNIRGGSIEHLNLATFNNGIYFLIIGDGRSQTIKKLIIAN